MFIKYDYLELLEFFENDAISVGDKNAGIYIYKLKKLIIFHWL
jgi:hypothetical protein